MRRPALPFLVLVLALAGCGGGEQVRPTAETVIGEVTQAELTGDAESGKALFASQGCSGCHAFEAAGSDAEVGPSLNADLQAHAEETGQSLEEYVHSSLVSPNEFVVDGFNEGVMPPYASLDQQQLADLVAFVTENQG